MMEAVYTSEMSVYFCETTRCYIPEGWRLQTRLCFSCNLFMASLFYKLCPSATDSVRHSCRLGVHSLKVVD
jgi:hypothetical protein